MSRTRDENEKLPRFDDETKLTARRQGLEDLMRRLEELTAENNKLRARRQREALPQAKMKTLHLKRMSPREGRKEEIIRISFPIT
jgi:hypothetical protein